MRCTVDHVYMPANPDFITVPVRLRFLSIDTLVTVWRMAFWDFAVPDIRRYITLPTTGLASAAAAVGAGEFVFYRDCRVPFGSNSS